MKNIARVGMVSLLALSLATTDASYAAPKNNDPLGGFFKGIEKSAKSLDRSIGKLGEDKNFTNALGAFTVIGAGLVIGGALQGNGIPIATGLALGTILVATSPQFQKEMAHLYADDWKWSGCTNCGSRRVVHVPGRTVSSAEEKRIQQDVITDIKNIQLALAALGLYTKAIDGDYGPGTIKGVKLFQAELGKVQSGTLNADQRARLFASAAKEGFVREGFEPQVAPVAFSVTQDNPDAAIPVVNAGAPAVTAMPSIKEYKLAQSQFEKFNDAFLAFGDLTSVGKATMRPDGMVELTLSDSGRNLVFGIEDVHVKAHDLSDQWARITVGEEGTPDFAVLNTVDTFTSEQEAGNWIAAGTQKIGILAKLSERPAVPEPGANIVVAKNAPDAMGADDLQAVPTEKSGVIIVSQDELVEDDVATAKPAAGVIVIDDVEPVETAIAEANEIKTTPVVEVATMATPPATLVRTVAANSTTGQCSETVYVSLNFPNGENPITHYNILPPEGTLMMDNGDSTAYFAGNCVQGEYKYKYVYLEKKGDDTFDHHVREGAFVLARNGDQCDIDLNNPLGSAIVECI